MEPMSKALHLSVLVVDDCNDTAESLAELLTFWGCETRAARDGKEALREVAIDPPDVVLLDIKMPGMDGWDLARQLAGGPKPPLLVAISGCGLEEDRKRSAEAGIHLHLLKPVEPAVLVGLLKRFDRFLAPGDTKILPPS